MYGSTVGSWELVAFCGADYALSIVGELCSAPFPWFIFFSEHNIIRLVLDSHSLYTSKEIGAFLETHLGLFAFVFTLTHDLSEEMKVADMKIL